MKCFRCNGKHHLSICEEQRNETMEQQKIDETPPKVMKDSTVNLHVDAKIPIMLQTAQVRIYDPQDSRKFVNARLIFDSGSQKSNVLSKTRNALDLPTFAQEQVVVNVFGQ